MIINLYVSVSLAIALFALIIGSYAGIKAYKIHENVKDALADKKYELEKDFTLISTVGWLVLSTRILAIPLFWITVISLISSVPGAMCEFGVFQAGYPFSWLDLGIKLFSMFAFGGWLFFDFFNRKMQGSPMMATISKGFLLLLPLLLIDAFLDVAFFTSLRPLVVTCCMVVYPNSASGLFNIGCPFCFITYKYPLLWGVISAYCLSIALIFWSFLFQRSSQKIDLKEGISGKLKTYLKVSIGFAVIGTILLIIQILLGSFNLA
ncbi:MAG TPA: hypothetical protein VK209_09415 [Candidatus Sulfotelmatobacter sp.]|nr:hypothetical protein [Candidatus Sulfotelmatobacter sp.]